MSIKLSTFSSFLHQSDSFSQNNKNFINEIETKLNKKLELSDLDDYNCDLKLIFIQSGGSEGKFLENISLLKEPYYFLTSGDNNSLAATLEIVTYLNSINKKSEIIHGSIEYIANRINNLENLSKVRKILSNSRLGVIGKPSDWLISSIPNYNTILNKYGINLIDINIDEINKDFVKNYDNSYNLIFDKDEIGKANGIYVKLKNIVNKYNLDGLTIRCFDLLTSLKSTGCLGLSLLNKEGIIGTCEGDIMAMISMKIVKALTNQSSFQANPSRIDVTKKEVLFAHCTIPLDMVKEYKAMTHFESGIGLGIRGKLEEKDVTVFRISADNKRYFVEEGKIIANLEENNLCRTQIIIKFDNDISQLLTNPCGNHHIIFYGRHKNDIINIMNEFIDK